jgi:uncharacterized protein YndB with AHSA1/START domain
MHDIVHELTIAAPPEKVFEAVTTQEGLAGWWTHDATASPEVGSVATFGFAADGTTTRLSMRIDELEGPELVHWACVDGPDEWVGTAVAFRVEGVAGGGSGPAGSSIVRFWHGQWEYEDGMLPRASFEWAMYLDSLRRYVETGTGSPA